MGGAALDLVGIECGGRAPSIAAHVRFQRQLLELAQQSLLATTDLCDERLGGGAVEEQAQARRLTARPACELPGLDRHVRDDEPPSALDRLGNTLGRLGALLLAREQRQRGLRRDRRERRQQISLRVRATPALDPLDDDHPCSQRERHRRERLRDRRGCGGVALEHLDARGPAALFGERAQAGPPFGDRGVVVAVDEVGGAQLGCRRRALRGFVASRGARTRHG